ncbi:aminotransferase class V-fold PLP-dependent enzyme [Fulvivirgaceae bacterium BMA10]|uniref:Aminotransferase class V-fold PLP-dependent enzyme n=1 Tax=Splendidivirga corallicola TaxID=3051826 RepID=A0ABT8KTI6_9BACT|nr:aminotransferase class V-fold PLP-dependent enzyme [Fulvivirgaceae bacterium BMA10]
MSDSRRSFFKKFSGITAAFSLFSFSERVIAEDIKDALVEMNNQSVKNAVQNEDIWSRIRQAFTTSSNIINLNNGGVSPQPKIVQDAVDRYYHLSNEAPSYYMWRILDQGREPLRAKLADLAACSPEEIAINRNTTEALDTVIFGMRLEKGDEVVLTKQDYPNMIHAWKQREMRDGIKLKWLSLDLPMENDDEMIGKFIDAITPKTKVLHITHMINWTGQILPAQKICLEARKRGIKTIVDGAHSFAHLDFEVGQLGCDYFGTSLHKWLCAPFGTGMLYIRKENVADIWPLFPNHEPLSDNIRKFEGLGTRSFAPEQAIGQAIDFHRAIGNKRKEARLHFLKNYWVEKVKDLPKFKLNTSMKEAYSCAIANFSIDGIEPGDLANKLFKEYKIHTSPIVWENISGVRITPHVYTTLYDLDRLVEAIQKIAQ